MSGGWPPIARLRARLVAQVAPPLVVSAAARQYVFDAESAAYAEIDLKRGDAFAVVIVIGSLPEDQFIVDVWQRLAPEVWLVDPQDEAIYVARTSYAPRVLDRSATLRSVELPGVAIPVDALFALPD